MAGAGSNIINSPMILSWKVEAEEVVDYKGLVAADMGDSYFLINSAKDAIEYYVWHNLDAGGTDPSIAGKTGVEIAISTGDTPAVMAAAYQAAIDALPGFDASVSGTEVTSVRPSGEVGETTEAVDVDSGVRITICKVGKDLSLGQLEATDLDLAIAPTTLEINTHQFGVTPVASIMQGFEVSEFETSLLETGKSKVSEFYKIYGGQFTPAAGTEVSGMGTSSISKALLKDSARLELVPANVLDADLNYQITIMQALPVPGSLLFSGENPRTLSVSWKSYADPSIDSRANVLLVGDPEQAGLRTI